MVRRHFRRICNLKSEISAAQKPCRAFWDLKAHCEVGDTHVPRQRFTVHLGRGIPWLYRVLSSCIKGNLLGMDISAVGRRPILGAFTDTKGVRYGASGITCPLILVAHIYGDWSLLRFLKGFHFVFLGHAANAPPEKTRGRREKVPITPQRNLGKGQYGELPPPATRVLVSICMIVSRFPSGLVLRFRFQYTNSKQFKNSSTMPCHAKGVGRRCARVGGPAARTVACQCTRIPPRHTQRQPHTRARATVGRHFSVMQCNFFTKGSLSASLVSVRTAAVGRHMCVFGLSHSSSRTTPWPRRRICSRYTCGIS